MHPQPLITVPDVEASSRWYQEVLGATSAHGGPDYERLEIGGRLVLQLHDQDPDDHHGRIDEPNEVHGNGVLLWFATESAHAFDAAVERIGRLGAEITADVHVNPNARQREIWLRDPDGYGVVVASPAGDTGDPGDPGTT